MMGGRIRTTRTRQQAAPSRGHEPEETALIPSPDPAAPAPARRPQKLRDTVLEHLRTAIIIGELAEGTLVSAPSLGQELGVSATPVREAMMELSREGLVETVKNKGFRITGMSGKDLDDLAQIRLLLEPPAMRLIAGRIPEEEYADLQQRADACLRAAQDQDLTAYLREDRQFHARILSFTGNRQLVELVTSLRLRTRLYGIRVLAGQGMLEASARDHHELIRLLRAGDGEAAERLMEAHISHARPFWATNEN